MSFNKFILSCLEIYIIKTPLRYIFIKELINLKILMILKLLKFIIMMIYYGI